MKIPKSIRKMSLSEFESQYGGDVIGAMRKGIEDECEEVIERAKKGAMEGKNNRKRELPPPTTPGGGGKRHNGRLTRSSMKAGVRGGGIMATPGKGRGGDRGIPETPATVRAPKRGEIAYSENGSPIAQNDAVLATVKKSRGRGAKATVGIELDAGDGTFVDIGNREVIDNLDEDMKKNAVNKLKSLQDEVAALMAQLGN